ncbi:MAG: SEC-C domain-containing protein, partial [Hyphomicrobiales bacterium]|nr:SEC-C domain-containing protein [Hyphomicrobiales bacterium]
MSAPLASLALVTLSASVEPTSPCPCRSGLRYGRCCGLDWTAPRPEPAPDLAPARAALAAGHKATAKRRLVEILERSPK